MSKVIFECVKVTQTFVNKDAITLDKKSIDNIKHIKSDSSPKCKIEIDNKLNLLKLLSEKKETKTDNKIEINNEIENNDEDKENDDLENKDIENNEGLFLLQQISALFVPFYLKGKLPIRNKIIKDNLDKVDKVFVDKNNIKEVSDRYIVNSDSIKKNVGNNSISFNKNREVKTHLNKNEKSINYFNENKLNLLNRESGKINLQSNLLSDDLITKIKKGEYTNGSKDKNKEKHVRIDNVETDIRGYKDNDYIISDNDENNKLSLDLSKDNIEIKNKIIKSKNDLLIRNNKKYVEEIYSTNELPKHHVEKEKNINDNSLFQFGIKNENQFIIPLSAKKVLDIPQWSILKNIDNTQNTTPNLIYAFKSWGNEKHQIQIRFMLDNQLQLIASTGRVYQASIDNFNQYQGRYSLSLENREKNASWHINAIDSDDPKNSEDNQ